MLKEILKMIDKLSEKDKAIIVEVLYTKYHLSYVTDDNEV